MSRYRGSVGNLPQARSESPAPVQNAGGKTPRQWFRFENVTTDSADIYIYDEIGSWFGVSAQDIVDQLKELDTKSINLHINSPGGSVFDGVAIFNAFLNHPATVNVFVEALAASAASFIAQCGDTVTMRQGSMMMIHDAAAITMGNAQDMRETADLLDKVSGNIADLYTQRAGMTADHWRAMMKAETWYTAQEAVDGGLADSVSGKAQEDPTDHWDLSVFNYAGRSQAPSPSQIANKVKEKPVSGTDNKNDEKDEDQAPAQADQAGKDAAAAVAPVEPPPGPVTKPDNQAPAFSMTLGDKVYTDRVAYQMAVDALVAFQRDTKIANRKQFVAQLATDNKISVVQIGNSDKPGLEAFALSLSDEVYAEWVKTWDAAPASPLFARHTGPSNTEGGPTDRVAAELADQIEIARATVKNHRDGGAKDSFIKTTDSYKFLEANNAL